MVIESRSRIVKHLVNRLRDTSVDAAVFRGLLRECARMLLAEAVDTLPVAEKRIDTWQGGFTGEFIDEGNIVCVAILRAALPMQEGVMAALDGIEGGFLAMKRDEESFKSRLYYDRIPDIEDKTVILVDPMVATGGSLHDALTLLRQRAPARIVSLNVIGAKEGVERIERAFPDIDVHIAQIDPKLDKDAYIVPGLGDAGDRAYNTV